MINMMILNISMKLQVNISWSTEIPNLAIHELKWPDVFHPFMMLLMLIYLTDFNLIKRLSEITANTLMKKIHMIISLRFKHIY